ncbi:NUDIX domain-containing protein [Streptomyces lunaelactis]|uniref:NUDIX hydrolase n=1 Tax=Streptomyces lunaelactis TaxID=1535768 RepID=UPI001585528F|nr:NUDIX hydrolase [Streptomyces lunaelactis]NUK51932.1 NUDIX domain-containing protein [Streptomyces lunaelactis]NUK62675.1 NUDIX domain-containing protein [Streptomyces lunaelactis]
MIVWINGAFGAGKTSTARELIDLIPNSTLFDPELIGGSLGALLPQKRLAEVSDYQDLPIWRRLVVDTAAALLAELGGVLVVPMTLLRQEYRDEIFGGLAARRIPVRHVLLAPDETILRERIANREEPDIPDAEQRVRQWAYEHIEPYLAALDWIGADAYVIDSSRLDPRQTAQRIAEAVRSGAAAECEIVQTPEPTAETLAAGVLLFDEEDRVLLVDPTYKPGWEFPGGVVERGEAPARAGMREVAEELGLELAEVPRLLVVDWEPPRPPGFGGLRLLFDGGRLPGAEAERVLLPGSELRGWRFVGEEEAAELLPPTRYERLRWALRARERGAVLNLEAGVPVG